MAVVVAVIGVVQLFQGQYLLALILLVAEALIGPGGYGLVPSR